MIKQIIITVIYLLDYWVGRIFYGVCYAMGKCYRLISSIRRLVFPLSPCFMELHYLREEVRRLKFANSVMRAELNRVKTKKLCLCKKLEIMNSPPRRRERRELFYKQTERPSRILSGLFA